MTSKLALRALGAVALPGAFLAVVAPTASAAEIAPLDSTSQTDAASGSESDMLADAQADSLPELPTSNTLNGQDLSL